MEEFETSCTDQIICPWCGNNFRDSWEMDDGEWDCDECGKKFRVDHDVSITYSTSRIEAN